MKKINRLESEIEHFTSLSHVWWGAKTVAGQKRYDNKAQIFKKICKIKKDDKILEIGCGDGEFTRRLVKLGNRIVAIDATPALIQRMKKTIRSQNVKFLIQDAENLKFKDESFDIVCGVSILHHLNYEKSLREAHRVLKKGGKIFFTEPNIVNPHMFLAHNISFLRKRMELSPHEIAFTRWQLASALRRVGYKNIVVKNYDFLHPKIPRFVIPYAEKAGSFLEVLPVIKEISGSLIVYAEK